MARLLLRPSMSKVACQALQANSLGSCRGNKACPGCFPALLHVPRQMCCAQAAQVGGAMPTDRGPNCL